MEEVNSILLLMYYPTAVSGLFWFNGPTSIVYTFSFIFLVIILFYYFLNEYIADKLWSKIITNAIK